MPGKWLTPIGGTNAEAPDKYCMEIVYSSLPFGSDVLFMRTEYQMDVYIYGAASSRALRNPKLGGGSLGAIFGLVQ